MFGSATIVDKLREWLGLGSFVVRETTDTAPSPYSVQDGALIYQRPTKDGTVDIPLANFNARVVSEEVHDDGTETSVVFRVEGELADGTALAPVDVPAGRLASLAWVTEAWGNRAIVNAGSSIKDHLRCAIQTLSSDVPRKIVYAHSGWREMDGHSVYLHAGGAIGATERTQVFEFRRADAWT